MIRSIETYCKYDATRMMHVGNPQTIKSNRDLYVKYFRGWLKAHMLLRSNPTKYGDIYFSALKEIGTKTKRRRTTSCYLLYLFEETNVAIC